MEDVKIQRYLVEDALSDAGVWEFDIRTDYSGRFMYGRTCFGVVLEGRFQRSFLDSLRNMIAGEGEYEEDEDELSDQELAEKHKYRELAEQVVGKANTDDMGLSMIVYFPGVNLED